MADGQVTVAEVLNRLVVNPTEERIVGAAKEVFDALPYNGLGHVQAVGERPDFQKMWLEMVQWSMGVIPGDATPRSKSQE